MIKLNLPEGGACDLEEAIKETAVLIGCQTTETSEHFEYSLDELSSLAKTANAEVLMTISPEKGKRRSGYIYRKRKSGRTPESGRGAGAGFIYLLMMNYPRARFGTFRNNWRQGS